MKLTFLLLPIILGSHRLRSDQAHRRPTEISRTSRLRIFRWSPARPGRMTSGCFSRASRSAAVRFFPASNRRWNIRRTSGKSARSGAARSAGGWVSWKPGRASEVTPVIGGGGTIYYPFGGPDLLHVSAMFSQARNYALMGLEPVGEVPPLESLPPGEVLAALDAFRQSVKTQMLAGYFVTKEMRSDLERSVLRGVTPILLSTVAMMGGEVESVGGISAGGNPGVEVQYYDAGGMRHTAYYVAGDLSNSGFKGGYQQWVAGLGGKATYFKAASYLMHDDRFSQAREFFLNQSRAILQDDSGIPFRYFAQGSWTFRFFGNYQSPIPLFAEHQQEDLRQAFATNPRSPLGFGSGYHANYSNANLLLAIKR